MDKASEWNPTMDLTTVPKMSAYLTSRNIAFKDLELLSGGTCNFVFRLTLTYPLVSHGAGDSGTNKSALILKHAQPYIAQNPAFAFPTSRMNLEHAVLTTLAEILPRNPLVAPVQVQNYDTENHVLTILDGGTTTLKAAYSSQKAETIQTLGSELASWLAQLHTSTVNPSKSISPSSKISDWWCTWENDTLSKSIYRFSYNALASTLKQYGYGEEGYQLGERVSVKYGSALLRDDDAICHGDFWPGNILLSSGDSAIHADVTNALLPSPHLTVVDFEMSRRGNPATDVAQFAAEAWLLDTFRGSKGLLRAFLDRYGKLNSIDVNRLVIHMGTHLICWPARLGAEWGDEAALKECVRLGRELILVGLGEVSIGLENVLGEY